MLRTCLLVIAPEDAEVEGCDARHGCRRVLSKTFACCVIAVMFLIHIQEEESVLSFEFSQHVDGRYGDMEGLLFRFKEKNVLIFVLFRFAAYTSGGIS